MKHCSRHNFNASRFRTQLRVAKAAMQKCYTPEAMHRYRKMRSNADFQRRELFSINRSLGHGAATGSAAPLGDSMPCRCCVGEAIWRCKGLFGPDIFSFKGARQRQLRSELFSSFLRYFLSLLSFVVGLAAVASLSRIRKWWFPSVLVSRKSFSVVFLQAEEHSADFFIQLRPLIGLCMVVEC